MSLKGFRDNPVIREFNGLKRFFRSHETSVSRQRIKDLKKFTSLLGHDEVAFDLMGSVNFGQAQEYSDTDIVIYLRCGHDEDCEPANCEKMQLYKDLLMNTLVYQYMANPYSVHIVDCINLDQIDREIESGNITMSTVRFGFYRSVCRGINRKLLRKYESMVNNNPQTKKMVEESLQDCFSGLKKSSQHSYSFKKYVERMEDEGIRIPANMAGKIHSYLNS